MNKRSPSPLRRPMNKRSPSSVKRELSPPRRNVRRPSPSRRMTPEGRRNGNINREQQENKRNSYNRNRSLSRSPPRIKHKRSSYNRERQERPIREERRPSPIPERKVRSKYPSRSPPRRARKSRSISRSPPRLTLNIKSVNRSTSRSPLRKAREAAKKAAQQNQKKQESQQTKTKQMSDSEDEYGSKKPVNEESTRVRERDNVSPSGRMNAKNRIGKINRSPPRDRSRSDYRDDSYKNGVPSKGIPTSNPDRVRGQCRFVDKNGRPLKHIKNTESFTPNYIPMQMRVRASSYKEFERYPHKLAHNDAVIVNDMYFDYSRNEIYDLLLKQIHETRAYKNNPEIGERGLWMPWHGENHLIANDKLNWKQDVPIFNKLMKRIEDFFDMDIKATRFNWYRDSKDWKPFHFDAAAVKPDKAKTQNLTIGVSFGAERDIAFEHADNRCTLAFPLIDGSVFGFCKEINCEWRHGIPQLHPDRRREIKDKKKDEGRISIIAWGYAKQFESM